MSRTSARLQPLSEPAWISGCRALWGQPLHAPTEAMLERWPEARHYRAVSRPAGGRLRRRLGWLETVTAIALEDDGHAVVALLAAGPQRLPDLGIPAVLAHEGVAHPERVLGIDVPSGSDGSGGHETHGDGKPQLGLGHVGAAFLDQPEAAQRRHNNHADKLDPQQAGIEPALARHQDRGCRHEGEDDKPPDDLAQRLGALARRLPGALVERQAAQDLAE